jgi:hypothetical protein
MGFKRVYSVHHLKTLINSASSVRIVTVALLTMFNVADLSGQADPLLRHQMVNVDPVSETEAYRPTGLPDRITLTWTDDPSTSQTVTWRTDTKESIGFGQIAPAADGPFFRHETIWAETRMIETNLGRANYHTVRFTDLEPATKYIYRVGDGINWSEWFQFETATASNEPFSFVYFGDWQEDVRSQVSRVVRQAYADAPDARFFVYAGDLVDNAHNDGEWGEWFHAHGFISAMMPLVPSPGNHEYAGGRLSVQWKHQFALPDNGPEEAEGTVYYIDYQGVRIISLDSRLHRTQVRQLREEHGDSRDHTSPITRWLDDVLKENEQHWTVVITHYPVFASQRDRDNPEVREQWKPLFDKYRVDLVLQGHDHSYFRTGAHSAEHEYYFENDHEGSNSIDPTSGTVYVVSMAGSKQRCMDREDWMARVSEDLQLYHVVYVDSDSIRFETKTATGRLYDAFSIHKRPGQPNEIIEQIPADFAEHLRDENLRRILPCTVEPWFYHERRFGDPSRR